MRIPASLFLAAAMTACGASPPPPSASPVAAATSDRVDGAAAHKLVKDGATLVDVRTPEEFATKHVEGGRRSTSAGAYLKVIVGEGSSGGGNVMIDAPMLDYKRSAAETENVNEEFTLQAR